jgi:hypothetical protein
MDHNGDACHSPASAVAIRLAEMICLNGHLCFFLLQRDALLANESVRAVN